MIPYCYDATAQAEAREAAADRDAIKCDCCGGLIRVGEVKFSLAVVANGLDHLQRLQRRLGKFRRNPRRRR